jgi:hypothetical protein
MANKPKSVTEIIHTNPVKAGSDFTDEGKLLAELLITIIDIKYRNKYGNAS